MNTTSESSAAAKKLTRMTADFTPEAYETLTNVAEKVGGSKAEAVRKALGLFWFLLQQKDAGWTLVLEKGDRRREIVTL